jgi:hypothetical protein
MGARSSPEAIRQMAEKLPLGAGGQPPNFPGAPGALPGLGGKLPGLGGPPAGLPKSLGKKK